MAFTQQRFLGASIRGFDGNIGWGNSPSRVTIRLVEDPAIGDVFLVPTIGDPLIFSYSGWSFGGFVTNYEVVGGQSGSPLYEVTLEDPRVVLEGVLSPMLAQHSVFPTCSMFMAI